MQQTTSQSAARDAGQIVINEEHLGTEGTEAEAREMVRLLSERGYDIAYGPANPSRPTANQIPDSEWREVLDQVIAGEEAR